MGRRRRAARLTGALAFAATLAGPTRAGGHGPDPVGQAILFDSADPAFIYAASNVFGHFVSIDGGDTYGWICADLFAGSGVADSLAIEAVFLAGSAGRTVVVAGTGGLFTTRDDGCTWSQVDAFDGKPPGHATVDPANPDHWLVTTIESGDTIDNALFESFDAGSTWARTALQGPNLYRTISIHTATRRYHVVSLDTETDAYLLHTSTDEGLSWAAVELPEPPGERPYRIAGVDPANADVVYLVAIGLGSDILYLTRDGGEVVDKVLDVGVFLYELSFRPDGSVWLGRDGGGPFVSVDGGQSWLDGPAGPGLTCFADAPSGLYACNRQVEDRSAVSVSVDGGALWEAFFAYEQSAGPLECLGPGETAVCDETRYLTQCIEYHEFGVAIEQIAACDEVAEFFGLGGSSSSGGDDSGAGEDAGDGCSCATGARGGAWLWFGVLLVFVRRGAIAAVVAAPGCAPPTVRVPDRPAADSYERREVAGDLHNPRGVLRLDDGSILVAEAGLGDPQHTRTGRLLRLMDGQRRVITRGWPSVNIVTRLDVRRDEVFGFADIARGGGVILTTVTDPTEGSTILRLTGDGVVRYATTADNANSLAYHPGRRQWFAVQSFANTLITVPDGEVMATFEPLADGQDAVPAAVAYEPASDALLVALFSGQRGGDTRGSGVDFVERSGALVRVESSGRVVPVVENLNAPVDLAVAPDGSILVLEFCARFVDPTPTLADARGGSGHGGFERNSGRLLRIEPRSHRVTVLAHGLDLPTNLHLDPDGRILITAGQGTPGRTTPDGPIEGTLLELRPG